MKQSVPNYIYGLGGIVIVLAVWLIIILLSPADSSSTVSASAVPLGSSSLSNSSDLQGNTTLSPQNAAKVQPGGLDSLTIR